MSIMVAAACPRARITLSSAAGEMASCARMRSSQARSIRQELVAPSLIADACRITWSNAAATACEEGGSAGLGRAARDQHRRR